MRCEVPMWYEVPKFRALAGSLRIRGDKSISHRAVMLSALCQGKTKIYNLSSSDDVKRTCDIVQSLGVGLNSSGGFVEISGKGIYLNPPEKILYAGNSGTTARIFSTILSAQKFPSVLDGDESLRRRPMLRVVEPLRKLGAKIWGREGGNRLPLVFEGIGGFSKGGEFDMEISSAQVKTALLLANLWSSEPVKVREKIKSRDHTERMLPYFSIEVVRQPDGFIFCKGKPKTPELLKIPGDISSASFIIASAILGKGSEVEISDVLLNPTRTGFISAVKSMGADVRVEVVGEEVGEHFGFCLARYCGTLKNNEFSGEWIPLIIDEIPILSICAIFSEGVFSVRDAKELRVKETDRIYAICSNLRNLGIDVQEYEDGFSFEGLGESAYRVFTKDYYINTFYDHRIAMSFFVFGMLIPGRLFLDDVNCISVSYPEFFDDIKSLGKT